MRRLSNYYRCLEASLTVTEAPELGSLVVPNSNQQRAFHRWFHLKEGYSCELLTHVLKATGLDQRESLSILDPFVGGGTTLISAGEWAGGDARRAVQAFGIDRNPFLAALSYGKAAGFMHRGIPLGDAPAPEGAKDLSLGLSTFENRAYFPAATLRQLVGLRCAIEREDEGLSRCLRLLALAMTVEPASYLRRDGRTLRYYPDKTPSEPVNELKSRLALMQEDLVADGPSNLERIRLTSLEGDGRRPQDVLGEEFMADLIVCSPPYPNNIDYTEVYKLEAWFLRAYADTKEFRDQRTTTLRSHPSCLFDARSAEISDAAQDAVDALLEPVIDAVPSGRYMRARRRVVSGYFADLAETLESCAQIVSSKGSMAVVVGNSLHGAGQQSLLVAADILIGTIAQYVGWTVDNVMVARRPPRRRSDDRLLRESIVFLKRRAGPAPAERST